MQKIFSLDFVLHSLAFGGIKEQFFALDHKFDLIINLLESQVNINSSCGNDHSIRPIFLKIFRYFTNVFLSRLANFQNDYVSSENLRKLSVFSTDIEMPEVEDNFETSN